MQIYLKNAASYRGLVKLLTVFLFITIGCAPRLKMKVATGPVMGKPWDIDLTNTKLPMVWVGPGTFIMGSPASEKGRKPDEGPQTIVTLTKGYWLGKTEVTVAQWKAVTGMNLRDKVMAMLNDETLYDFNSKKQRVRDFMGFDKNNPDKIMANENAELPMYFVSWSEAMDFCRRLNEKEKTAGRLPVGYEYTLPTEAQWEHACRAGTTGANYADDLDQIAWYGKNSANSYTGRGLGNSKAGPRNAGEKSLNALGLQDMEGNLWEWCYDWYGPYAGGEIVDPAGPSSGQFKVNRGGSWGSGLNDERSANRAQNPPNEDSAYRGFRIALCAIK